MIRATAVTVVALMINAPAPASAQDATRVGAISLSYVARSSKAGKAALAAIEKLVKQKEAEVVARGTELEKQRESLQKSNVGLSPRALVDLQKAFEKTRLEFERFQQDAQDEVQALQAKFDADFRIKLSPIIDAVSKEKGLQFVFGLEQAAIVWWSPTVDISADVVKRLDGEK